MNLFENRILKIGYGLKISLIILFSALIMSGLFIINNIAWASWATTTVTISICGNAIVDAGEFCDEGFLINGQYASSSASRRCGIYCDRWAPYCGDGIVQQYYGEECDDSNNASQDRCSNVCKIENLPITGGGGGSGPFVGGSLAPLPQTKVIINGKAYPDSNVRILKDGATFGIVRANNKGDFHFESVDISAGVFTFGFWAEDRAGLKSIAFTLTFRIVPNAVTTIYGAYLPPTISLDKRTVKKGEIVRMSGQTISEADVYVHVNSAEEIIKSASSTKEGMWSLLFDTKPLQEEEFHTAKALFKAIVSDNFIKSSFSQAISFYVGEKTPPKLKTADLNKDGKVNLTDFSILLFHWGTTNEIADINSDNKVNLADFSIMMYQWTG